MRKLDVIVDLQYGSTGKGLIAGVLAKADPYDMVVSANMPNAGHTFIDDTGKKWVHKVLPNGIVSETVEVVGIGPGAVFSIDQLRKEVEYSHDLLKKKHLVIHESAVVLSDDHVAIEQAALNKISSTMQGSAAAMVEKIMRNPRYNCLAGHKLKDTEFEHNVVTAPEWVWMARQAELILLEGAQGFSLGINSGFWPYCTSRDCSPARFVSDCHLPHSYIRNVIGAARVHPIRVGNTTGGTSGPGYPDQRETSWEKIGVEPELTTVTRRKRRVFTFSRQQMTEAILYFQPNRVFLNFCNYNDVDTGQAILATAEIIEKFGPPDAALTYTGWGPKEGDVAYDHA